MFSLPPTRDRKRAYQALFERNILTRHFSDPLLAHGLRISIGSREDGADPVGVAGARLTPTGRRTVPFPVPSIMNDTPPFAAVEVATRLLLDPDFPGAQLTSLAADP
ncbi:MAG: hypothetical protein R2864_03005 [Syntrophotaleaceae bacterium]